MFFIFYKPFPFVFICGQHQHGMYVKIVFYFQFHSQPKIQKFQVLFIKKKKKIKIEIRMCGISRKRKLQTSLYVYVYVCVCAQFWTMKRRPYDASEVFNWLQNIRRRISRLHVTSRFTKIKLRNIRYLHRTCKQIEWHRAIMSVRAPSYSKLFTLAVQCSSSVRCHV